MKLKHLLVLFLMPKAFFAQSFCRDDESFFDSSGWSCRDYNRVPQHCKVNKRYGSNGKLALTSCCVCWGAFLKSSNIPDHILGFLENFGPTNRRLSQQCLHGCFSAFEDCSDDCDSVDTSCKLTCSDVESTCYQQCEQIEKDEEEEADGVVEVDKSLLSSSAKMEWFGL